MITKIIMLVVLALFVWFATWLIRASGREQAGLRLKRKQIDGQIGAFKQNAIDAFDEDELRRIVKDVSQYMESSPLTIAEHSRCNINRAYIWGKISMLNHMMGA